jgi:polar amino acid transport system permease protein
MSDFMVVLPYLMRGLGVTVMVFVGGAAGAIIMSLVAGLMRGSPWAPLRWLATAYIEIFRGTSVLVQLFWFGYVLPQIGDVLDVNLRLPLTLVGVVVLGLAYGAYGAELLRGAIRGIPEGQTEAAVALNFTRAQRMWHIILPQAIVHMLPPMGNLQIELLKNTALVFFIGLNDITQMTKILRESGQDVMLLYTIALVLYFALALLITAAFRATERVMSRGMRAGGAAA